MSRILIAEDEPRIAAFMEKGLRKSGFDTIVVQDGNAVLPMLNSQPFDLLLLDLGLPNKDGWNILEDLQRSETVLPVVIVTAQEVNRNQQQIPLTASALITKPFSFSALLKQIEQLI